MYVLIGPRTRSKLEPGKVYSIASPVLAQELTRLGRDQHIPKEADAWDTARRLGLPGIIYVGLDGRETLMPLPA